ncbi:sulfurtransferase TusA family protein [Paenibacillus allorhizosphaerae]|uniref:Sulfur carrier protein TusA n=1 Tax=Paenibacillus allorhizosphaerae TaxID=2849866 RepID=A0ABM8VGW3_9BACL|nr:sulfurtransferase TusA family protein [Paenibacillus allorhizosphaerae]CAG7639843.1 Sulfur carrier protein TusA [Paenibacillus allorhizosphaerae]
MSTLQADRTLECEGLACPMPVVRTKKAMEELNTGEVLEVRATDKGSVADLQSWAKRTGHQYIGLKEEGEVYRHFIRKADPSEVKTEAKYPHTASLDEIKSKLAGGEKINILDVREPAEYAFGRLPGAKSIPAGELEQRMQELNPDEEYFIVCRTGSRSDMACQTLAEKGFTKVKNVLPGMREWTGEVEKD